MSIQKLLMIQSTHELWGCCILTCETKAYDSVCKFPKYGHLLLNFWQLFGNHLSVALIREDQVKISTLGNSLLWFSEKSSHLSSYLIYISIFLKDAVSKQNYSPIL